MEPIIPGITFVPRYIKQVSDMEYGSVVSHENYNEKLNLNSSQGDYNTEILKLLFGEANPARTPHIPYLDKIITDEVTRLDQIDSGLQDQIDTHTGQITNINEGIEGINNEITKIINGVTKVGKALQADKITGVENAGRHRYYGTNYDNQIGFHEVPDSLYAREYRDAGPYVADLVFIPADNSITEAMLTQAVADKLNRPAIDDYEELNNLPQINSNQLKGNKTASQLGLAPAGNYLVPSDLTGYATETYVNNACSSLLPSATAATTYATITSVSSLSNVVTNNYNTLVNNYARVGINAAPSNPIAGDLWVTV